MKSLKIFLSKDDNSLESAKRIQKISKLNVEILYIEDVDMVRVSEIISDNDIVYFLCNNKEIYNIIQRIQDKNCIIINKEFLKENYRKDQVQILLNTNNIKTPPIIAKDNISDSSFPLFCKENTHTAITVQMYNKTTLDRFFKKFDINDFYFEEVVGGEKYITNEIKVYFIKNEIFGKDGERKFNHRIQEICKNVSKTLNNLEIFSIDLIEVLNEFYVIDLNPSSGFFHSTAAREMFVTEIEKY